MHPRESRQTNSIFVCHLSVARVGKTVIVHYTPVTAPGFFVPKKWSFCWYFWSQKNTPRRDDSPDMGLLLSHRPTFGISPSASGALFVEKHASLSAPIGDGAVLRRGDLHPIKAARRRQDIVGKPEPQSPARNARPDAREMVPRFATCRRMEPILDLFFVPGTRRSGHHLTRIGPRASRV